MSLLGVHLVSGGFDPIHSGHIDLLTSAGTSYVHVALNSDEWLVRKKGNYLLTWDERATVLREMVRVGRVIKFNDSDDSACDAIEQLKAQYPQSIIHFYNGGDRNESNILEAIRYAGDPQVKLHFGVGGSEKKNSSSSILAEWDKRQKQTTDREWGVYDVIAEFPGAKVKTLTVSPGQSLSRQKHEFRNEHWFIAEGSGKVELTEELTTMKGTKSYTSYFKRHEQILIPAGTWHKLINNTDEELFIVEIQYGEKCEESDIVRRK